MVERKPNLIMSHPNILSHYESILKLKAGEKVFPRFADLHTSNRCNQHCRGCAYQDVLDSSIMSKVDHFSIVHQLLKLGVRGFDFAGGGEPLSLPYIEELWKYINHNECDYGLITNGTLLTDSQINQILTTATYIRISLEASDMATYCDYKRVNPSHWHKVLANLSLLISRRKQLKSKCEISLKFSVSKRLSGFDHYRNAIILGKRFGVDAVQFKSLRHKPEELTAEEKESERVKLFIASQDENPGFVRSWVIPYQKEIPQCWLNPLHTVVDYNGDVYLCCYYYYRKNHCIGNMIETTIKEFWMNENHIEKIKAIDKDDCKKVDCKFFRHHETAEDILNDRRLNFL